jgi:hypothetical protein
MMLQKTIATENTSKSTSGNFCISSLAKERGSFYVLFWPQLGIEYIVHIFWCSKSFQLPMQSVPFTTDVVSSNLDQGEVYNIM